MSNTGNARYAGCTHTRVHRHGTRACVLAHQCPCTPCRDAARRYAAGRDLAIAEGRWTPMVDAAPVREHVALLRRHGMTLPQLARAASRVRPGGDQATVRLASLERLVYGQTRSGVRRPVLRVRSEVARAVRAVSPQDSPALVAAQLERTVESLVEQGWDDLRVGSLLIGTPPATRAAAAGSATAARALVCQAGPALRAALDRHVERTKVPLGVTLRPEAVALARGTLCHLLPGATAVHARGVAVAILLGAGLSVPQAAQVLGVSRRTVERRAAASQAEATPHI